MLDGMGPTSPEVAQGLQNLKECLRKLNRRTQDPLHSHISVALLVRSREIHSIFPTKACCPPWPRSVMPKGQAYVAKLWK